MGDFHTSGVHSGVASFSNLILRPHLYNLDYFCVVYVLCPLGCKLPQGRSITPAHKEDSVELCEINSSNKPMC